MQFFAKFGKIIRWRPPLEDWHPLLRGILDPPLECVLFHSKVHSYILTWPAVNIRWCLFADCYFFCDKFSCRIFTGRNEVLAKVMFLQAFVILSTGGCLVQGGCLVLGGSGPGGVWSRGGCLQFGGFSNFSGGSPIFRGVSNFFWGGAVSRFSRGSPIFRGGLQPEYGQRSAGTHPTGMHSCCNTHFPTRLPHRLKSSHIYHIFPHLQYYNTKVPKSSNRMKVHSLE